MDISMYISMDLSMDIHIHGNPAYYPIRGTEFRDRLTVVEVLSYAEPAEVIISYTSSFIVYQGTILCCQFVYKWVEVVRLLQEYSNLSDINRERVCS